MVMKSVPIDDMNCIVFAIRGSQTFMDWAVNLNSAPVAPTDFLVRSETISRRSRLTSQRMILGIYAIPASYQSLVR
jgi:hypothetical protein